MKTNLHVSLVALVLLALLDPRVSSLFGQSTAFTYQGRLNDQGNPANGIYDLQFTMHDAPGAGSQVSGPLIHPQISVNDGLFFVQLDFGSGIFTGAERWMQVAVRTNGASQFIPLLPRQQILAAPYAVTAREVTGNVAAGQLTGVIAPGNIGAGSITSLMLADGNIHSNHLAFGSVHSNALVLGSIHSNHLALGSIHSNHLAAGSVHSNALAFGSVTASALADGVIHSNHLGFASVHSNALALGIIHSNHLAVGSIYSDHLAAGSIHSNALAFGSITANALGDGVIHSNHLAFGSVDSNALMLGSIHSNHLAEGSVHSNILALGSVTAVALADGAVHSNHLGFASVHSNALALGIIHSNHLAVGSIHSNHLAAGSVHSNALAFGSITATALADGSIHSNHLAFGSVHSNALALGSVTAAALVDGIIHSNHLAVGSVHSNALALGSVTADALAAGSIHSNHLAVGSIHSNAFAIGSVTAAALAAGSIHSNHLAEGSVHSNILALGSVTASALAVGSIHSNHLSAGAVSMDSFTTMLGASPLTTIPSPSGGFVNFGGAVAAVGADKLLVGANQDSNAGDNAGAAYLFATNGTLLRSIFSPAPQNQEHFGFAVAAVGPDKLVIGADGSDRGAVDAGVVYLLSTNGTLLITLTNPTPAASDFFGYAVAAVGTDKVLVGAHGDHFGANLGGAAYLFNTSGTLLTTITNPTPASGDRFGIAVAAVGNDKVLIGADRDDTGATDAGAAYLFQINGTLLATFTNPTPASNDAFGAALTGVGSDKVLIGASGDNSLGNAGGAAYLFDTSGTLLTTIPNPTPASGDQFGMAVVAVGQDSVLIGAPFDDSSATDGGAAYLFDTTGKLLKTLRNPTPANGDLFGAAVTVVGTDELLIGASFDDAGFSRAGAAQLFKLETYVPSLVADTVRPGSITTSRLDDGAVTADKLDATIGVWTRSGNNIYRTGGNVGVGTTSPQTTLHVSGNNSQLRLQDSFRNNYWNVYTENHPNASISGNLLFLPGPTGTFGFIQKSSGSYFSGSDARLKTDVHTLSGVLDRVLRMRPVSYRFKTAPDTAHPSLGFIAQEMEMLFPEVVDEHEGTKSLAYSALVPVAIGAIQELNQKLVQESKRSDAQSQLSAARIQQLEAENTELKRSMLELKTMVNALAEKLAETTPRGSSQVRR